MLIVFLPYLTDINECATSPCVNEMKCIDLVNDFACECQPGWRGKKCDESKCFTVLVKLITVYQSHQYVF